MLSYYAGAIASYRPYIVFPELFTIVFDTTKFGFEVFAIILPATPPYTADGAET
jgi:hypothetical protein